MSLPYKEENKPDELEESLSNFKTSWRNFNEKSNEYLEENRIKIEELIKKVQNYLDEDCSILVRSNGCNYTISKNEIRKHKTGAITCFDLAKFVDYDEFYNNLLLSMRKLTDLYNTYQKTRFLDIF